MKFIFTIFIALFCSCNTASSQFIKLAVNEFSQGASGSSKEFIELLVIGTRTCKDSTVDIRNWIFDDNNGWYGGSGTGIATGHYRFANNANWAAVPFGSIILLYNNADKNNKITQPNDPTDANKDYVYIVPINNPLIEENNATPVSPSAIGFTYPATGYGPAGSTWTTIIGLANSGDAIIIVDPSNLGVAHFSIGYGGIPAAGFLNPTVAVPLAVNGANNCYVTNNQYNVAAGWAEGNVPTNETPGAGNTAANIAWINSMRIQVPPPNLVITNPAQVCAPATVNLTAPAITAGSTPATMVFTYYADAAATTLYPTPTAATNGTYYIVGTIPGGCADTLPVIVTVQSTTTPVTGFSFSPAIVCANGTDPVLNTVAGFTTGGTFSALPAGLSIDPTTGAISLAASSPGTYTVKYTIPANACNPGGSSTASFKINPSIAPETQFSYTSVNVCEGAPNPNFDPAGGFVTGGTFTVVPSGLIVNASTGAINVAASVPGNYTIIYSIAASGCAPASNNSSPFVINTIATPVTGFSYSPASVCVNGADPELNTVAGFTIGGTYTAVPAGLSIDQYTGAINVAASAAGNYTITYAVPSNGCNSPSSSTAPFSIVTPGAAVTGFSYTAATVCANGTNPTLNTVAGFTTGGTYSAVPAGLSINASTGAINVAASNAGNYTVTYAIAAGGCSSAGSSTTPFTITASVTPVTGFSYSPATVCANAANPTLTNVAGFTTGGTYTALPAGLSINASTGAINVAASSAGNYTITYSVAANGCNPAATNTSPFTITAGGTPVTSFNYVPATVCANGTNPAINQAAGFTGGGTYTALPAGLSINAGTGAINVAASSAGNYTITYSVTATGCSAAATNTTPFTITASVTPVTGFTYSPATVCAGATNPALNNVAGFTTGGTYTALPAGLSINASTGAINVAASTAGNYTITYFVAANGCNPAATNTTPFTITAIVNPVTVFTYSPATVCANGTNPTLNNVAGFTTGGTYTALPAGLSINASTGAVNVAASTAGNYTITYSVAANGCNPAATNTTPFTIIAIVNPVTSFSYSPATLCANGTNPTLNNVAGFTTGGTYSALPAGLSINASTGAINVAASTAGNYTITYSVAANGCNPAATNTTPFTITAIVNPVTGFTYSPATVCANGANPTLNAGFTTGGTYSALPAGLSINANTGAVNVAASTAGNYTITYSVAANGCNPAATNTTPFTITAIVNPVTGFSYSPATVCAGGTNPALNNVAGFTTGGIYSALPAGLSINANTGAINVAASTAGNYTITYFVAASGCNPAATNTTPFTITAIVNPVTGFTYSPAPVCANGTNPTLNNVAGFTTGGTYAALPAGLSINASTGAVNVAASTPGNYTITYSVAATGCNPAATNTTPFTITAIVNPVTGFSYSPATVCAGGTNPTLTNIAGFTNGGTYTALPAGLSINASTGAINVVASTAGNYTITYSVAANGCNPAATNTAPFSISAITTPVTGFNYSPVAVCVNGTNPTLNTNAGFTAGGTYSAVPAGLSINANTGAINVAASSTGNYTITYLVAATGCNPAASNTASFSINAFGAAVTGFSYAPSGVCANGTNPVLTIVAGFTAGGVYSALPAGLSINAGSGAINVAASAPGNYTITYTLAATACTPAASNTSSFTITANSNPVTVFSYAPVTVCANGSNPSLNNLAGFATGGTYTATPAGLSINANTGAINVAASTAGVYTVQYAVAANGCVLAGTNTTSFTITTNSNPVTSFSYSPNAVCANGSNPAINGSTGFTTGGIYTSSPAGLSINANTGAINVAASTAGVYTIVYTVAASGCRVAGNSNSSFTITANTAPNTNFTYNTPVCINAANPAPAKAAGFSNGGAFTGPAGLSVDAVTGIVNLSSSTAGNFTITYSLPAVGCILAGTGTAPLQIASTPAPPVIPANAVCSTGVASLTATGSGIIKWYADAALTNVLFTGNVFSTVVNSNLQFFVTASVGSCVSNAAVAAAVISPTPAPPNLGNDTTICTGDKVVLNAGNYDRFLWSNGSTNQTITVDASGVYSVKVYNSAGCSSDTSISISVLTNCDDISFPNAFTPNDDGKNDKFGALGNLFVVKDYALIIYNRYGEVVFSTSNPYQKWDGSFKGSKYGNNNFVWVATYKYRGKISKVQKGNVLLIR